LAKKHTTKPTPKFKKGDLVKIVSDDYELIPLEYLTYTFKVLHKEYNVDETRFMYTVQIYPRISAYEFRYPMWEEELKIVNSELVKAKLGLK
jgi:hypothetical protein